MTQDDSPGPMSVADARDGISRMLKKFRSDGAARPVVIGSHRKSEAVLMPYEQYVALRDGAGSNARELLSTNRNLILRLARLNRIASVAVFGSVARGDDSPTSDIDFLVDPEDGATLFDLSQFGMDLEQLLGRSVDIVSRHALDPIRDGAMLSDSRPL